MIDLSWAVQKAVFEALSAASVGIVDLPNLTTNMPDLQVFFGEDAVQEIGSKDSRLERHDLTIHVMVTGSSRKPMRDAQEKIRAALHEQPIICTGTVLSPPVLQSANGQPTEASTILGTQTFLIFAQPDL